MTLTAPRVDGDDQSVAREFARLTDLAAQGSVRPVAMGLAALYAVFSVAHIALLPGDLSRILAPVALGTAIALAMLARVARGAAPRINGHRSLALIGGLALGNSLLHLALTRDPVQTTNLYLVVIGCGMLLFCHRYLAGAIVLSAVGWAAVGAWDGFADRLWLHFGIGLASATVLSIVIHVARNRFIRRVALLEVSARQRELRLSTSETRFRHLFSANPAMICVHDLDGTVTDVNAAGAEALGGGHDDIVGQPIERFLVNGVRGVHRDYLDTVARLGRAAGLARVRTLDGRERSWLYDNTKFDHPDTGPYVLGTALDVTELQDAREALEVATADLERQVSARTEELRAANARLEDELQSRARMEQRLLERHKLEGVGRLAAGIAHEFNNILGIIRGNTELATLDATPGTPSVEYLQEIEDATMRGADLVDKIVHFSRPETGDHMAFSIGPLVHDVVATQRQRLPGTLSLAAEVAPDTGELVGNPEQIRTVLIDLIDNARQAMPAEGGQVRIRVSPRHRLTEHAGDRPVATFTRVEVSDTGVGIPARNLPRVFDPFFTTRDVGKGYGLGLSVAHGIIRAHGGEIRVDSPASGGTRVVFFLPESAPPATARPDIPGTADSYILVVDDEPAIVRIAQRCLERRGFRVRTATNGTDALMALREASERPALLVTDISMPGLTGDDLLREARAIHPDLRALVMSGYGPEIDVERLGGAEFTSVLSKPFRAADLDAAIETILPSIVSPA